jgi:hypothetical protein
MKCGMGSPPRLTHRFNSRGATESIDRQSAS